MLKNQIISQLRNRKNSNISDLADSTVSSRFTKEELGDFLLSQLDWDEAVALNLIDETTLQKGEQNSLQALTVNGKDEVVFEAELPPAELPGLYVRETFDKEQEHFAGYDFDEETGEPIPVWDDSTSPTDDPWFTLGGTMQETNASEMIPVNTWMNSFDCPNMDKFYSQAKSISWRKQRENFVQIMRWIFQNKDNKELLRRGWKRFWQRVYQHQAKKDTFNWMWQRQIKSVKAAFEAQGIKAQGK